MTIFDLRGSALSKLIMRQTVSKDEAGSGLFEKVYLTHPLTNKRANTKSNGKVNGTNVQAVEERLHYFGQRVDNHSRLKHPKSACAFECRFRSSSSADSRMISLKLRLLLPELRLSSSQLAAERGFRRRGEGAPFEFLLYSRHFASSIFTHSSFRRRLRSQTPWSRRP